MSIPDRACRAAWRTTTGKRAGPRRGNSAGVHGDHHPQQRRRDARDFELSADEMVALDGLDTGWKLSAARSRKPESRRIAELAVRTLARTYELASLVRV